MLSTHRRGLTTTLENLVHGAELRLSNWSRSFHSHGHEQLVFKPLTPIQFIFYNSRSQIEKIRYANVGTLSTLK